MSHFQSNHFASSHFGSSEFGEPFELVINGLITATLEGVQVDFLARIFQGQIDALLDGLTVVLVEGEPQVYEDPFRLAKQYNKGAYSTVHANPGLARLAERLKNGPGGTRFRR